MSFSSNGDWVVRATRNDPLGPAGPGKLHGRFPGRRGPSRPRHQENREQADCAAKVFENSKISDKTLRELVKGNGDYKDEPKSDDKALAAALPDLQKCV